MSPKPWSALLRSTIALFCLLFPLTLLMLVLHEGGHALDTLARGERVTLLYVHPFAFAGFSRPVIAWDSVWMHIGGTVVVLTVSLALFLLLWRRRSLGNLPLVMLFPWSAFVAGIGVMDISARTGDYYNIMRLTGLPGTAFYAPGALLILVGLFFLVSLLPLAGLAPRDARSLVAVPAAFLLWSLLSLAVARLVVPGSPVDVRYHLGEEVMQAARTLPAMIGIVGLLIGAVYIGPYRWLYPRLPARLRSEVARLTWRDLRWPAILCTASVIVGLAVIA